MIDISRSFRSGFSIIVIFVYIDAAITVAAGATASAYLIRQFPHREIRRRADNQNNYY